MRILKILIVTPFIFLILLIVAASFHPDSYYRVGRTVDLCLPGHPGFANWWYDHAAGLGHTEAQSYAGMYYLYGFGPQDKKKGIDYLRKAAEKGDVYALSSLASAYEWGLGVKQDFGQSVELTEKIVGSSNDKGDSFNSKTRSHLAFLLTVCPPPIQDFERAFKIFTSLEERAYQDTNPAEYLGFYYLFGLKGKKDLPEAARYLEIAGKLGSGQARSFLGNMYLSGRGVEKDFKKAHELLVLSARQGEFYAMELIALSHALDFPEFGNDKDTSKWLDILVSGGYDSFSCLKDRKPENASLLLKQLFEEAETSSAKATICGVIYLFGVGVEANETKAFSYLDKAIELGSEDAKAIKASFICDNPLNRKDFGEAVKLLEDGWKNKNKACGIQLAIKRSGGVVCEQDWDQCFKILSSQDLKNHGYARFLLGQCYLYGLGTGRDVAKGLKELLEASKEGNSSAALYIYDNYQTFDTSDRIAIDMDELLGLASDLGVPEATYNLAMRTQDRKKALKLLQNAAQAGYIKAQLEIENRNGSGGVSLQKSIPSGTDGKKNSIEIEIQQIKEFQEGFTREADSKEVLVATRNLKKGEVFTRDSFKISKGDFVLDTYLDGHKDSIDFLVGRHAVGEIKEGSEISIFDVGAGEPGVAK